MSSDTKTSDDRIIELLEELVKWQKVNSIPNVKKILEDLLKSPEQKIAYSISDGKKTVREIAKLSGLGKDVVSREWRKWTRTGIAEPIAVAGGGNRAKSTFTLEEFGVEVPKTPLPVNAENNKPEETEEQVNEDKPE